MITMEMIRPVRGRPLTGFPRDPFFQGTPGGEASPRSSFERSTSLTEIKNLIYVVDDDVSVCRALSLLLGTYGFSVRTFLSAEAFLGLVMNEEPGCLVMDIHLPGLDGWQTLARLVKSGSWRSVIIISGEKNEGLRDRALKAGAVGYLQKPFHDQDLVKLIHKSMEGSRERDPAGKKSKKGGPS